MFYQTQYTDPSTGDVLMQSRWYSPDTGTFRSRDTWAGDLNTPVSLNRYTYANNNPSRYWDPTGFCSQQLWDSCLDNIAATGDMGGIEDLGTHRLAAATNDNRTVGLSGKVVTAICPFEATSCALGSTSGRGESGPLFDFSGTDTENSVAPASQEERRVGRELPAGAGVANTAGSGVVDTALSSADEAAQNGRAAGWVGGRPLSDWIATNRPGFSWSPGATSTLSDIAEQQSRHSRLFSWISDAPGSKYYPLVGDAIDGYQVWSAFDQSMEDNSGLEGWSQVLSVTDDTARQFTVIAGGNAGAALGIRSCAVSIVLVATCATGGAVGGEIIGGLAYDGLGKVVELNRWAYGGVGGWLADRLGAG